LLRTRIITALALGSATTAVVLLLPSWAVAAAIGVLWIAGVWEWTQFAGGRRVSSIVYTAIFVGLMLSMGPLFDAPGAQTVAAVAVAWWVLAAVALWAYPWRIPAIVVAASGPFALLPSWFLLAAIHGSVPRGPELTLSLLFIIWAADMGAYFFGRRLGRVKLAPQISPGKTWEGVIGGLGSAALMAAVTGMVLGVPLGAFVSIAMAASLVSIIGDLTFSMFKRNVGLKDSGRLLPGHGGVLDRIDSLAAAVPFFFIGLQIAGI
jgi:phosphatidate cytidylyltransferase